MKFDLAAVRQCIAPLGVLRVAINLGNSVLAQRVEATGQLSGVSVALAHALADELDLAICMTPYDAAGKVFGALEHYAWDLAFLAIEPVRAEKISFTTPYVCIDGTYLVKTESTFQHASDLDRQGCTIAVGKGAAYDLFLSRTLKNAELTRADTSASAVDAFLKSGLQAAAGVRQPLERFARTAAGVRVLQDNFTEIRQAMAIPKGRIMASGYVQHFVDRCLRNGFVANALNDSGEFDARVAQPLSR
jgi:polar amino acid transport system substrate-binding protein